jgi:hypothetical protein
MHGYNEKLKSYIINNRNRFGIQGYLDAEMSGLIYYPLFLRSFF